MKIGIIREGKVPPDSRVPLTPKQCKLIQSKFGIEIVVEHSSNRCFPDQAYLDEGINVVSTVEDCEILLGVKEVPIAQLIANKTYFFFSHTIKAQPYNQKLLQAILQKNIRLIDYEVLTDANGKRLIAFGKFAGMVGAHNALWTYGQRTNTFALPRMKDFFDYSEAVAFYKKIAFPPVKIVLTGTGRVGQGARLVLKDMGIEVVTPGAFLENQYEKAVFTQLKCRHYVARKIDGGFDQKEYYQHPDRYKSIFFPYSKVSDMMINGIYWDNVAPVFFTAAEMKNEDFQIQVIADVTCDIAPVASIPSTLRASTIAEPVYGYQPATAKEIAPFRLDGIDVMAIDNLPNELPRDASTAFGKQFVEFILPALLQTHDPIIERATIAKNRKLTERYSYLKNYVEKE